MENKLWEQALPSFYRPQPAVLIGGFHADLPAADLNDFHEFIIQTEEWKEHQKIQSEIRATNNFRFETYPNAVTVQNHLQKQLDANTQSLYYLAKKWAKDRVINTIATLEQFNNYFRKTEGQE